MTEVSRSWGTADRDDWVEMWREAVRASRPAVGLVELSTTRFIEMSTRAAELLGTTPEAGLDYLSVAERPQEAAEMFRLAREGMLDGVRAHRRFRRPDGSTVEVMSSGWVIRSRARVLGLWVACDVRSQTDHSVGLEPVTGSEMRHIDSEVDVARITLDYRWRVAHISAGGSVLLGRPAAELVATSIIDLTHPDDLPALLLAFARTTTDRNVGVRVRLRHDDGRWRTSRVAPTLLDGDGTSPFVVVVAVDEKPEPDVGGEAGKLAGHLRRIAAQIEASGTLVETAESLKLPTTTELSARQWQIVSRLVRGQRVSTIAAEMYLSQSTVRNHLSAIFRKVGVNSQQELLAQWRGAPLENSSKA